MKPTAYYNENNKDAATWLRNLIDDGQIPYGHVDNRSIADVRPADLAGFTQCHFFAGIGGWGLALRLAGWPDARPIWTGSCPCQPFSVAGKGAGFADARDLWPTWFELIRARRPAVVMGEQVARTAGAVWFARTRSDLEEIAYTARGAVVPACAVAAPHERERLWFVADTPELGEREPDNTDGTIARARARARARDRVGGLGLRHGEGTLADAHSIEPERHGSAGNMAGPASAVEGEGHERQRCGAAFGDRGQGNGGPGLVGNADRDGQQTGAVAAARNGHGHPVDATGGPGSSPGDVGHSAFEQRAFGQGERGNLRKEFQAATGTSGGFWRDAEWLQCADGKQRRLAPGVALLAHGVRPRDVAASLAGFGNAIVPQVAAEIIGAYLDTHPCSPVGVNSEEDLLQ